MDAIVKGVMEEIRIYFNPNHWSLLRLDETTQELFFIAGGDDFDKLKEVRLSPGEGIAGKVVETGEEVYVSDTSQSLEFSSRIDKLLGFHTKSLIAVPVKFQNITYGVIEIINRQGNPEYTTAERTTLRAIADFTGIAFANARLYEQSLRLTTMDPLTGCFNRRKLMELLEKSRESISNRRTKDQKNSQTGVVIIDLDNFKHINDDCGHAEGDRVLKKTAEVLLSIIRQEDQLYRIGGDEFLVLLKDVAQDFDEKQLDLKFKNIPPIQSCQERKVEFSFGYAFGQEANLEKIIHRADIKMYENKKLNHQKSS